VPAADRRARSLALTAAGLARGAGMGLPVDLELWRIAGGRPAAAAPIAAADPAAAMVAALEQALTPIERKQGAHYTPAALAERLIALAVQGTKPNSRPTVVDPACGGGAILLAAGRHLVAQGIPMDVVARDLLWGADVDPLAAAVADVAIALWSRGTVPATGHIVVADTLLAGRTTWATPPRDGFDLVVGNPPFQGQLAKSTARSAEAQAKVRARFGAAMGPYADTAALFLLAGVELAARGGRVALVQPRSTAAARDAGPVRDALAAKARLVELWAPRTKQFAANVHVCVPVLAVGRRDPSPDWTAGLAAADGVPTLDLGRREVLGSMATALAGFRQHYYGLVPHVREAGKGRPTAPLVTSGLLGVGASAWGRRPVRFAGAEWQRPAVDRRAVGRDAPEVGAWLEQLRRPKVLVASQTKVVEAAVDREGGWVPCTPVVSILPRRKADLDLVAAALCAPPAAAWAASRAAGTGLSPGSIRMSTDLALAVPLPEDQSRWEAAARALAMGDLEAFAAEATAAHRLPGAEAEAVLAWWHAKTGLGGARPVR
jgi:hypothetical protein